MRTPWHIRAWATGTSLAINGVLVLGAVHMAPQMSTIAQDETAMLISLGDPSLTAFDNAASPEAKPAPEPASKPEDAPKPPSPVEPPAKTRPVAALAEAWVAPTAAPAKPAAPLDSDADARPASSAPAATAIAAKAMTATAAKPPAGRSDADSVQAHAGSSNSYAARVRAWLESNKTYPKAARMRKQQGVVRVAFVIDRDGHVLDCRLVTPTGHALLDQEAMAMVRRSDPFPTPPHTVRGERIAMDAPVEFALNR
ncbi:energy transducer TonB [Caulobacter sp.]|uniref:TonB family protein n=1 Tax=Caulobacter sp. TaxID=78 RepID=UPI001620FEB5